MTSYVNSYVEKTNLLRALLGDVRNQPIKRLMADVRYIYNGYDMLRPAFFNNKHPTTKKTTTKLSLYNTGLINN